MRKIVYLLRDGHVMGRHDAAYVNSDLATELAESVVDSISTEIEVRLGETTVHLAMLLSPDHWSEDWMKAGVDDVDEFLAGLVEEE